MTYITTEHKYNFFCSCGYERSFKEGDKMAETVRRLHFKVCPKHKIKARLTEKPMGFGAANLPSVYEFYADQFGRNYKGRVGCAMDIEKTMDFEKRCAMNYKEKQLKC